VLTTHLIKTKPLTSLPTHNLNVPSFDLWDACIENTSSRASFLHAFRMTEHVNNKQLFDNPQLFVDLIFKLYPAIYVFQIEIGMQISPLHFQDYLKL